MSRWSVRSSFVIPLPDSDGYQAWDRGEPGNRERI